MYFKFTTTTPDVGLTDVVLNLNKVLGVESNADGGTIVVDGDIMYRCQRLSAIELQTLLMKGNEE